jgi:hypothetical protein
MRITDKQIERDKNSESADYLASKGRTKVQRTKRLVRLALTLALAYGVVLTGTAAAARATPPQPAADQILKPPRRRPSLRWASQSAIPP